MKNAILIGMTSAAALGLFTTTADAQCRNELRNLAQTLDQQTGTRSAAAAIDVRTLRHAAQILADRGMNSACETVVDSIRSIHDQSASSGTPQSGQQQAQAQQGASDNQGPQQGQYRQPQSGQGGSSKQPPTRQQTAQEGGTRRMQLAQQARPLGQLQQPVALSEIDGAVVYSSQTGNEIGSIEDIVIGHDQNFAIVSFGGFLGLGEKRIQVPLNQVRFNPGEEAVYIPMSQQDLQKAPAVQYDNGHWMVESGQDGGQQGRTQQR